MTTMTTSTYVATGQAPSLTPSIYTWQLRILNWFVDIALWYNVRLFDQICTTLIHHTFPATSYPLSILSVESSRSANPMVPFWWMAISRLRSSSWIAVGRAPNLGPVDLPDRPLPENSSSDVSILRRLKSDLNGARQLMTTATLASIWDQRFNQDVSGWELCWLVTAPRSQD